MFDDEFESVHVIRHVLKELIFLQDFERRHVEILPAAKVDI